MKTSLNFAWRFATGFQDSYLNSLPENSPLVDIPHSPVEVRAHYFSEEEYQGLFTYEKEFDIPDLKGKRAFLLFEGVMLSFRLVLNGHDFGTFLSGYVPVEIEITDFAKNKGNKALVVVDSREDPSVPPFGKSVDYLTFAGIYRPVYLLTKPQSYLSSLYVHGSANGDLKILYEVNGAPKGVLSNKLYFLGGLVTSFEGTEVKIPSPRLYSLEAPNLYTLESTWISGATKDVRYVRFGFRDVKWKEDGFYLNGKKIKLIGLNRHQSYPYVGYALPKSAQRLDAEILRLKLGCNVVRTSHYPQSEDFLERCDELGLLVIDEIPGWQYIGKDETWRNNFSYYLTAMIKKERNHPSLIAYGTRIDESPDDDELYSNAQKIVHSLDPYRQTLGVRNFKKSHCLEDIYAYNDFSCSSISHGLDEGTSVSGAKGKPLLVTEHNGHMFPTKSFDHPSRLVEQALRHLKVMDDAYGDERIAGALGWCAFDYNTHQDFGSGDHICYHGVADIYRFPKPAAYAYLSQNASVPVMWVANPFVPGDENENMPAPIYVFTNCDYVEFYKNDKFIEVFRPRHDLYPHLPHPPVVIDDFIGALFNEKGISKKDSLKLTKALNLVAVTGLSHLKKRQVLPYLPVLRRNRLSFNDVADLFGKYINSWGEKASYYKVIGYKLGKKVMEKSFGPSRRFEYRFEVSSDHLQNGDTYDVARVGVMLVDQYGTKMPYAHNVISLKTDGPISVIGPTSLSLVGGDVSFYVRSEYTDREMEARLTVQTEAGDFAFEFRVS